MKNDSLISSPLQEYLHTEVQVVIDRPLGSKHPKWEFQYPINYGYLPNTMSGDGEEIDAYILGVKAPVTRYNGTVIAIVHRLNDNEDKLVVSNIPYPDEEILKFIQFQEQYFEIQLLR